MAERGRPTDYKMRDMQTFEGGIASLVTQGLYDFEAGVSVVTENMERRHCRIGKVRMKMRQRDMSDLARQPGVQIETIWR